MSRAPSSSSLIVPLDHRRERSSEDTEPILWRENNQETTTSLVTVCSVCQQNESRYTCPKCKDPYCKVECYRNHASNCTETFYQNHVNSILHLEAIENGQDTQKLLQNIHEKYSDDNDLSEEELYELLIALEENEDPQKVLTKMSPSLRATFQRDVQSGQINVLEPWHPWWRRELGAVTEDSKPATTIKILDERLVRVPHFSKLFPKGGNPPLLYNLIEIVYSICCTLRLYHGFQNAPPVEASSSFVFSSGVLDRDARYTSLEQVLAECTASSTQHYPDGLCNTHWTVLAEDCARMVVSHRLIARALLDASDLLKAATQQMKKDDTQNDNTHKFRRIRKKLEFYLSWSIQCNELFGEDIQNEIMEWIERWSGDEEKALSNLQIPEAPSPPVARKESSSSPPPLMVEVETKRKVVTT